MRSKSKSSLRNIPLFSPNGKLRKLTTPKGRGIGIGTNSSKKAKVSSGKKHSSGDGGWSSERIQSKISSFRKNYLGEDDNHEDSKRPRI